MKMIVGLGNPGRNYEFTRHNVGFRVLDLLSEAENIPVERRQHESLTGDGLVEGQRVILVKPQTFMNNSGVAVSALARWYKLPPEDILVIYDDLDLEVGRLRIRCGGGAGGHNGIKSLIQHLGTDAFSRIRFGIGRPRPPLETVAYVLQSFDPGQQELIIPALVRAALAVKTVLKEGVTTAMNKFNVTKDLKVIPPEGTS